MTIGELPLDEISGRMRGPGLRFSTGPFVFNVHSRVSRVAENIALLYAQFPLASDGGFADFHVNVRLATGIRRVFRPQALFDLDGHRPFTPLPGGQASALLEWGMNWCIYTHAHQFLILHGAVLERGGMALMLPGPPGSGKSTLCAGLMHRGWRLLSDELILCDRGSGEIAALARPVSLKNVSIDLMRHFASGAVISEPMHDTAKGSVAHMKPTSDSVERADVDARPRWVVFPRFRADARTQLECVEPADVFFELVENEFNYSLLQREGFRALARLVDAVDGYRLEYGDLDDAIARLNRLAEESI